MNIIDYAETNMASFEESPFNHVDSLVLSQLVYFDFAGLVPGLEDGEPTRIAELLKAEHVERMLSHLWMPKENYKLLLALGMSPRFRDIRMDYYQESKDEAKEKQFAAITYLLDREHAYLAYRGTDSSFVAWKEDFNMAFVSPVPAQQEGVQYLSYVAEKIPHTLMVGGHSKGGNIAVYSAMEASPSVQDRITRIYSHDGPGFKDEIFTSEKYWRIKEKILKTLPQSSLVGMLLHHQEDYLVVKSKRFWVMQHDPFSWVVKGNEFEYAEGVTGGAEHVNKAINDWVSTLDDEKRELFVNTLYSVVEPMNATNFQDLTEDWYKNSVAALTAFKGIDAETRDFVFQTLKSLLVSYVKYARVSRVKS